jgi:hypothetical protein
MELLLCCAGSCAKGAYYASCKYFSVLCVFHCVNVPGKRLHVERDAKS